MDQYARTDTSIAFPRNALVIKVIITILLLGACTFFGSMAVLITHHSELKCSSGSQCVHIERYPFGVVRETVIPRVMSAETEWVPGGRVRAIKLVLNHQDGSASDYHGVGTNGERAQQVAKQLNAFLAAPAHEQAFPLRQGSLAAGLFLALLTLVGLVLIPALFTKVRVTATGTNVLVKIGRWPAPSRRYSVPLDKLQDFSLKRSIIQGQEFFSVCANQDGRWYGFDLGMGFRNQEQALQRITELNEWLANATQGSALRAGRSSTEPST